MTLIRRTLAVIMSVIMLLGMLPMTVLAADDEEYEGAEIIASGECGLYVEWKLNSLGTLFLESNGSNAATYDYPYDKSSPFRNDSRIKKIIVGEGVTYLGRMVFRDLSNLTEVVIEEGLKEMEFGVFSGCPLLTELELPASFNKFTTVSPFYESGIKKLTFKGNYLNTNTESGYAWDRFFSNVDIYVPLPFTLNGVELNTYEEAAQALAHNGNTVYCVNDNATVKWKNYDGAVLETDENAAQGVIPTFDGATPSRPSDPDNAYYFTGWTPEPREVTGDMVYTATYGSYGKSTYIDENGEEQEIFARPLTGTETELPGGWYVVNQDITYSNELKITGEASIILADGATLNIESGYILNVDETKTLNIYCQKDKSGVLSTTTIVAGSVNIYGGNLNVSFMLAAKNVVNIFDGNVNAGYIWAIENGGKIKILGGSVNVEIQLAARENITLGYKNPTDSIYIKNFDDTAPVINIVEGQSFANAADLSQLYSGTVAFADIKDKKLVPYAHNSITYARSLYGEVTGVSEADYGDEITLTVTPDEGYALDELTVTTEDNKNIEVVDNKFIMPATAVTVSATFISTKRYTVKWVIDGEVVETDENIPFGATPEYNGEVPHKAPTAQFTYTFEGWSPAITPVASDVTYTAQFGITINTYTVTWVVDGETVETDENVYYGMTPEYNGATPSKQQDRYYTYSFAGWSPEVSAVTDNVTYTAQFTKTAIPFKIFVKKLTGQTVTFDSVTGETAIADIKEMLVTETGIPASAQRLIFAGKELADEKTLAECGIEKESTVHLIVRTYTITWKNGDEVLATDTVPYGDTPEYSGETPIKAEDGEYTYDFSGWSPEVAAVTGDAVYTAQFTANKKASDKYNLTVEENIDVNILVDVNGHAANGEEIEKIEYTYPDVTTQEKKTVTETVNAAAIVADASGYFAKSFTLAIAQANEPIVATVYFTNGTTKDITVSVANYCKYIIDNAEANGYSDKLVNLSYAVLDYGKNAADYFSYEYAAYPEYTLPSYFNAEPEIESKAGIKKGDVVTGIASTQMFILSKATMRLTFTDDLSSVDIVSAKIGENVLSAEKVKNNGKDAVDISGITATELSKPMLLELSDGTKAQYAATDWAKSILTYSTNAKSKALAKSLYYYSKAANDYFA